jgi:hypothetical protein
MPAKQKKTAKAKAPRQRLPKASRKEEAVVPCKHVFTPDERIQVGLALTNKMSLYTDVENQKKVTVKDYDSKLKIIETEVGQLQAKYHDGYEMRDTKVVVHFNTRTNPDSKKAEKYQGQKRIVRADNGEWVRDEAMTPSDLQAEMFEQRKLKEESDKAKNKATPKDTPPAEPQVANGMPLGSSGPAKAAARELGLNTPAVPEQPGQTASTAATA